MIKLATQTALRTKISLEDDIEKGPNIAVKVVLDVFMPSILFNIVFHRSHESSRAKEQIQAKKEKKVSRQAKELINDILHRQVT